MASSRSIVRAQVSVKCQLCEEDRKLEFKCVDCDLLMCKHCKEKIHWKLKNTKTHTILDVRDVWKSPFKKDLINLEFSIVKKYSTNLKNIYHVSSTFDDSLWIGSFEAKKRLFPSSKALQKVRPEGENLEVIIGFNIQTLGAALSPSNDLLIATNEPRLKQIRNASSKVTDTNFSVEPLLPWSIHVTKENKIFVGAVDVEIFNEYKKGNFRFPVSATRALIVMDAKGNHINVYERDLNSELIFEIPLAITTSRNSNIFITDDIKCRVVVLGVDGDVQNTHTGRSIVGSGQCPFKPAGIITTPEDNIIVANSLNDALHVLDNCGNFLTCVITKELGILYPYALATTATGQYQFLYIACWTPDDSCEKAKLYKLKFSGC